MKPFLTLTVLFLILLPFSASAQQEIQSTIGLDSQESIEVSLSASSPPFNAFTPSPLPLPSDSVTENSAAALTEVPTSYPREAASSSDSEESVPSDPSKDMNLPLISLSVVSGLATLICLWQIHQTNQGIKSLKERLSLTSNNDQAQQR